MKNIKSIICLLLCLLSLAACGKTDNSDYFKSELKSSLEEMRYMPVLFSDYETPEDIKISVLADDTVTYSLNAGVKGGSGFEYQNINLHIKKHTSDISASIDSIIESYTVEKDSAVRAVKHEANGKKYAITYEIRPDLGYTVLNVIYPASENISAYFTLQLIDAPNEISDEILDKICSDLETVKL